MENARLDDLACAVDFHVHSGTVLVNKKKASASVCNLLFYFHSLLFFGRFCYPSHPLDVFCIKCFPCALFDGGK